MGVRLDEPGCDIGAGRVDDRLAGGFEVGADLGHPTGPDPDVRRSGGGARAVDHRPAPDEQVARPASAVPATSS